ncbi:hypothetical protein DFR52_104407 [Hoeflea marina]|uniref:Secreted protein with PEP-CTERM sorting signal n=1 Tax=Hoeflea marina TaxID=274592 RepID=A0A317PGE3_9HYPH|nr:hypothetical protein [Hoeflea marina]PWV99115.1 hypothetical protein DFR52_104407 [Hoeflea marina]
MWKTTIPRIGAAAMCLAATPALALDFNEALRTVFGSDKLKDLGVPMLLGIGLVAVILFWVALRIGKRRQRRMIEGYDAQLNDYSTRLRRNLK